MQSRMTSARVAFMTSCAMRGEGESVRPEDVARAEALLKDTQMDRFTERMLIRDLAAAFAEDREERERLEAEVARLRETLSGCLLSCKEHRGYAAY